EHVLDECAFAALAAKLHTEQAGGTDVHRTRPVSADDLARDRLNFIDRNRERLIGRGLELEGAGRGGVHAEDFRTGVDERAAGVARLDVAFKLDQAAQTLLSATDPVASGDRLVEGADLTARRVRGPAHAAGVADRGDALSDLQRPRVAEVHRLQA